MDRHRSDSVIRKTHTALVLFLLVASIAIAPEFVRADHHESTPTKSASAGSATLLLPIKNARIPMEGVLSGGQPTREQIEEAARAGYGTVINMRGESEPGFEWESQLVEELGMKYEQLPVTGKESLTREHIERLDSVLTAALEKGPVLLHCASGNRIGAVLALRAAWVEKMDPEQALAYGRASGMTGAESLARELLGVAAPDSD
jgi:uncharacterized protein (TIGR01244 family)